MLEYYGGSVVQALLSLFPNIGLNEERFVITSSTLFSTFTFHFFLSFYLFILHCHAGKYWTQEKNRRKFFDEYAHKYDFDPLNHNNWYHVLRSSILAEKVTFYHFIFH